jgi:predicted dehydrogenase
MEKLTSVIIGCGAIAREHLLAISGLKNVQVAAVCDLSAARAEATAERFGIAKWYSDYQDLLDDMRPDLVHITTPPTSHFSIARDCLAAGLNVFCEKPITVEYHEFRLLKQLANEKHCLLLENQNYRFHSSIQKICNLLSNGELGDVIDVQIFLSLNIFARGSAYVDQNVPHFGLALRGGVIGDFLTHIAYLAYMFTGSVIDLRTVWKKHFRDSALPADEFRAFIKGERATAYAAFSGNAQPDGFWIRVIGTRMHAEANLFEVPRLTLRRLRSGDPALTKLLDGMSESRDVLKGTMAGFWRKLGGVGSYDGLPDLIGRAYLALERREPAPIPLDEIDEVASLVDRFTKTELRL